MSTGCLLSPRSPRWEDALRALPHDVYHLPGYTQTDAELAGGTPVAYVYEEGDRRLLCPLVLRPVPGGAYLDASSPYGYSGPVTNAAADDDGFWSRALEDFRRTLGDAGVVAVFCRLHPLSTVPVGALTAGGDVVEHGETVSVDLTRPLADLWTETRKTHRNEINRARRAGLGVTWDDWAHLDAWVEIYHENMRLLGAREEYYFSHATLRALRDRLGPAVHLALAWQDDTLVAGQLVFEAAGVVQTHLAAMRTDSRPSHPDKLLYDEVRRWAHDRGDRVHHLGGGYGGGTDSLFRYKAGFGAGRHPFRTWRVVVDEEAYDALCGGAEQDAGGFFPAYRRRSEGTA
jgi:hypothetical protein